MNEEIRKELKIVVEQAVRPVRATIARKTPDARRTTGPPECDLRGGSRDAWRRASRPQSGPSAIRRPPENLPSSFSRLCLGGIAAARFWENMGYRPSESAWHLAFRHFFVMLPIYLLWLPTWMLLSGNAPNPRLLPVDIQYRLAFIMVGAVVLVALFNVILSIVLAPLLFKIAPALAVKRWRRILLAVLCSLLLLCGSVLNPLFTGVALLFTLMARQSVKEQRYQSDWVQPAQ